MSLPIPSNFSYRIPMIPVSNRKPLKTFFSGYFYYGDKQYEVKVITKEKITLIEKDSSQSLFLKLLKIVSLITLIAPAIGLYYLVSHSREIGDREIVLQTNPSAEIPSQIKGLESIQRHLQQSIEEALKDINNNQISTSPSKWLSNWIKTLIHETPNPLNERIEWVFLPYERMVWAEHILYLHSHMDQIIETFNKHCLKLQNEDQETFCTAFKKRLQVEYERLFLVDPIVDLAEPLKFWDNLKNIQAQFTAPLFSAGVPKKWKVFLENDAMLTDPVALNNKLSNEDYVYSSEERKLLLMTASVLILERDSDYSIEDFKKFRDQFGITYQEMLEPMRAAVEIKEYVENTDRDLSFVLIPENFRQCLSFFKEIDHKYDTYLQMDRKDNILSRFLILCGHKITSESSHIDEHAPLLKQIEDPGIYYNILDAYGCEFLDKQEDFHIDLIRDREAYFSSPNQDLFYLLIIGSMLKSLNRGDLVDKKEFEETVDHFLRHCRKEHCKTERSENKIYSKVRALMQLFGSDLSNTVVSTKCFDKSVKPIKPAYDKLAVQFGLPSMPIPKTVIV